MTCPCGMPLPLDECCGRLHAGAAPAPTAEALMRSRYSAFVVGDVAYLLRSWHSSTRPPTLTLDPKQRWTGLEIVSTTGGGLLHAVGTVEFLAHHNRGLLHENSSFRREDGEWRYVDGTHY